ncbi:DNA polymerase III subunit epsilon [Corynebacterium sp. HMSC074E01]|nr:DNA polymerase III subunit epsilon [Corynebacterium sp. HMSC074E01]OFN76791.1 DNA polymerase III subunit epsilon [Corynebacterium sp. HMSC074E01]
MTTTPGPTKPAAQPGAAGTPAAASPNTNAPKPGPRPHQAAHKQSGNERQAAQPNKDDNKDKATAREEALAAFPFVALTIQTTGIHPSTGRLLTVDALTLNANGDIGQEFHAVINPGEDPGPRHLHGLSTEEVQAGQSFSMLLKPLDRLLDGRTLIVHDAPYTWGFIVSEARRAMTAAARQNRARNRNRGKGRRRRFKVGHVPTPVAIVDTLATARRQSVWGTDIRLAAVARDTGLPAPDPTASVERAQRPEKETSREATRLLVDLYRTQAAGPRSSAAPDDLRADRFGLQRSHVRVDAAEAPRQHHNPGAYVPGKELIRGMEIVVAPEITEDPDTIIAALAREELNYSEKLTRETSLVVCNITTNLVGKPMHAHRKDIPLMSDVAFLAALERIEEPTEPAEESGSTSTGNSGGRHSSGQSNRNRSTSKNRRRSRRKSSGTQHSPKQGHAQKKHQGSSSDGSASDKPAQSDSDSNNRNRGGNKGRRRRRRGGRGRRGSGNHQKQQNSGHNRSHNTDS